MDGEKQMTTNETLRELLEMIGGVEWEEGGLKARVTMGEVALVILFEKGMSVLTIYESQALIEKAAIEWLSKDGRTVVVGSPGRTLGVVVDVGRWIVIVHHVKRRERELVVQGTGPTLLDALHAAVQAVKEQV